MINLGLNKITYKAKGILNDQPDRQCYFSEFAFSMDLCAERMALCEQWAA
jgi:hypothetical protein